MKNVRPEIYVVSGGKGLAGHQMVQSLLVQYPKNQIKVIVIPDVLSTKQIKEAVDRVNKAGGILVHTLVDRKLREEINNYASEKNIKTIDFMGNLADHLEFKLGVRSVNHPGLYRKINIEYFNRIEAIEYTMATDDGMNTKRLFNADIILTGVSRVGKTPLSIYLAMYGWKVANVPIVRPIEPPEEIFKVDRKRVFGLNINLEQLIEHRHKRMNSFGLTNYNYVDTGEVEEELGYARKIFKRGKFSMINVSNKPIESTANEIIQIMSNRFDHYSRKITRDIKTHIIQENSGKND